MLRCALNDWQREGETGAISWLAFDRNSPTMSLNHLLHDSQTEAGAACCARAGGVDAIESLEEVGEVFGRNAHPGIPHPDGDHRFIS